MPAQTTWNSPLVMELLTKAAGMPAASRAATWSFIREIRGEMTSESPGSIRAGTW